MRYKEVILEYSRDVTARQFGKKALDRLTTGPDRFHHAHWIEHDDETGKKPSDQDIIIRLIQLFESFDPTSNKQYVPWIAREYANNNILRLEDLGRVNQILTKFHKFKNTSAFANHLADVGMPGGKDINKMTWRQIQNVIEDFDEPEPEIKDKGESETVFDNEYVRVIIPQNQQAACYYGRGTRWCTASTRGDNYFNHYNKEGPLYIIIPKTPKHPGEKYQLHAASHQLMNEKDEPVPLSELEDFPGLLEFFMGREESMQGLVEFEDPRIIEKIHKIAMDGIEALWKERFMEWAERDSDYRDWLYDQAKDRAFTEEGDIDWDKVESNPDLRYTNYEGTARKILDTIDNYKDMSAQEIKDHMKKIMHQAEWADFRSYQEYYNAMRRWVSASYIRLAQPFDYYFVIGRGSPDIPGFTQPQVLGTAGPYTVAMNHRTPVKLFTEPVDEAKHLTPQVIHKLADKKKVKWDNEPSFLKLTKRLTGKSHLDDLDQAGLKKVYDHLRQLDEHSDVSGRLRKRIYQALRKYGYRMIGSGIDAEVWMKDAGKVAKIIISGFGQAPAIKTADTFYKFSEKYKLPNLPRYIDIDGRKSFKFEIGGIPFAQYNMEQLDEITDQIDRQIIYEFSQAVREGVPWEKLPQVISDRNNNKKILKRLEKPEYKLLYNTLQVLYKLGESMGFSWDIHEENVMRRPGTGELVVTDPWTH